MNNQFTYPKEKIRFAILTFFFAQGLCMASWASRIPDFKDVFAANYAFYWGLILFMLFLCFVWDWLMRFICWVSCYLVSVSSGIYAIYHSIRKALKWNVCMAKQLWLLFTEDGAWEPVPAH